MTALTKARRNAPVFLNQVRRVLAEDETAFEGGLACVDLSDGSIVAGQTGTGLLPIGLFIDLPEGGLVGDGTKTVAIRLFKEVRAYWFVNAAAPNAVAAGDFCSMAYILDDQTVTSDATGASEAGRVWDVHATKGVLIEPAISLGPQGPQGAAG